MANPPSLPIMRVVVGSVQHYAWGSNEAIPALLERTPDGRPWAEMWFGTHVGAPSSFSDDHARLEEVTGPLPYLAKFLAAAEPLSLQVHPSTAQAEVGFDADDAAGIALDAPTRTFKDRFAKPEIMIAITPFEALCGFREPADVVAELRSHEGGEEFAARLAEHGIAATVTYLLTQRPQMAIAHPIFERLDAAYPGDPGALVALLLHHLTLAPGEGVFLPAGELHMYLQGLGVEVMGASDNVVRGGLTVKHVDTALLSQVMSSTPRRPPILRPDAAGWYACDTPVFAVQQLLGPIAFTARGHELVLVVDAGEASLPAGTVVYLAPGERAEIGSALAYRVTT